MNKKILVTAVLGITLVLPVMAQTDFASQDSVTEDQQVRSAFMDDSSKLATDPVGTLASPQFAYI